MLLLSSDESDADMDAALATEEADGTPQSLADLAALTASCPGGFTLVSQVELLHYAGILLRQQGRIDHIVGGRAERLQLRELIWASLYPYLLSAGYCLPPRYASGVATHMNYHHFYHPNLRGPFDGFHMNIVPALGLRTEKHVALKIVCSRSGTPSAHELDILRLLNGDGFHGHPDNAAVPLLDVLDFPRVPGHEERCADYKIIVMPVLRPLNVIDCVLHGFALDLMRQSFWAVAFLHTRGICHRDIGAKNLMVDDTRGPPFRLRLIDFEFSGRFSSPSSASVNWVGGLIPPPEVEADPKAPYDPFRAEVYCLGETWRTKRVVVPELQDLFDAMTSPMPDERPTAAQCVERLEHALRTIPTRTLCAPVLLFSGGIAMAVNNFPRRPVAARCRDVLRHIWLFLRALCFFIVYRGWNLIS